EKLMKQNCQLTNIEVTDGNIKSFEKYARKYGIDFSLKKDNSMSPPRYYVFFKARDVDVMTAAFKEYTGSSFPKGRNRPSEKSCRWQKNVWQNTGNGRKAARRSVGRSVEQEENWKTKK